MLRKHVKEQSQLPWAAFAFVCVLATVRITSGQNAAAPLHPVQDKMQRTRNFPGDIEEALRWLPQETEAIVVSRGNVPPNRLSAEPPAALTAGSGTDVFKPTEYQDILAAMCIEPLVTYGTLYSHPNRLIRSFYGTKATKFFMKAVSWDGEAARETCDVVVFRDGTARRIVESLAAFPNVQRNVEGVRVLEVDLHYDYGDRADPTWQSQLYPLQAGKLHPELRYIAAPREDVYLAATSMNLLRGIIERVKQPGSRLALPSGLPEWRYVDTAAPAWGLRHYRKTNASKDRTSMLKWDPDAVGLVFFGGVKPSPFLTLRYVSTSNEAGSRLRRMQADWIGHADPSKMRPAQRVDAYCVETQMQINVPRGESGSMLLDKLSVDATPGAIESMYLPWLGLVRERQVSKTLTNGK